MPAPVPERAERHALEVDDRRHGRDRRRRGRVRQVAAQREHEARHDLVQRDAARGMSVSVSARFGREGRTCAGSAVLVGRS